MPTTRLWKKKAVIFKIETTYGTDSIPTGAANAIEIRNVSFTPVKMKVVDQNIERPYYGGMTQVMVGTEVTLNFDIGIAGSGAAGTAPAYGPLMRACGRSETVSAGVSVIYAPISAAFESGTFYINIDGTSHKILGCRGDFDIKLAGGAIPLYSFKFTGIYGGVTDVALPVLTMTPWKIPLAVNNANTSGFSLHGFSTNLYSLDISGGATIVHRDDIIGIEDVLITDRKVTGNVSIQAPTIAEKDFFTTATSLATGALSIVHGTIAGGKVQFDAPAVQLTDPAYEDKNGVTSLKMGMRLNPSTAGNDELIITVK
jgi:hypothetical protein